MKLNEAHVTIDASDTRVGYALAQAFVESGSTVTLIESRTIRYLPVMANVTLRWRLDDAELCGPECCCATIDVVNADAVRRMLITTCFGHVSGYDLVVRTPDLSTGSRGWGLARILYAMIASASNRRPVEVEGDGDRRLTLSPILSVSNWLLQVTTADKSGDFVIQPEATVAELTIATVIARAFGVPVRFVDRQPAAATAPDAIHPLSIDIEAEVRLLRDNATPGRGRST